MAKELYLYNQIYSYSAQNIIAQIEECKNEDDITIRINSGGGDVFATFGMMAKVQERAGKTTMKVDGIAASAAAMFLCFADRVECLDTSTIMLHRAEGDTSTPEDKKLVDDINASLRSQLESKLDGKKLKELKNTSIKNLFEDEKRLDLFLTASEAKQIGLVDKINKLSVKESKALNERIFAIAAAFNPESQDPIIPKTPITMTLEEIKAKHPELYAQIFALGVSQEKDRIEAILVFNDIDAVATKAIIASGKPIGQKEMSEFTLKAISKNSLDAVKKDSAGNVITDEAAIAEEAKKAGKTPEQIADAAFEKELRAKMGLKVTA